jgi:predicted transcriptional regulator
MCDVPKIHRSMRLDSELVASLDAMADHRDLDFTAMSERTIAAALKARQRSCSKTHKQGERCGECGLLLVESASLETI